MTQKLYPVDDTIVAVSTAKGRSGIGMVRLSGADARPIAEQFFRSTDPFADRMARFGTFRMSGSDPLDHVVMTVFSAPRSYTGEDVAEISAHGNPLILNKIVSALVSAGARHAGPGEFTLRAVAHGKMDLTQAEAIRDFIHAQTEAQARTAMLQIDGALSRRVRPEKEALMGIVAELEAGVDFAEDELEEQDFTVHSNRAARIAESVEGLAKTFEYGRLLGEGLLLAIAGKPNVGKSSLFNSLLCHDRAIVTEVPGTTRDVLSETLEVGGVPIRLSDTAGVRQTTDTVEAMGVARTLATMAEADLTLAVLDSSRHLDADDWAILEKLRDRPHLVVINKTDLPRKWEPADGWSAVHISALTGTGLDSLRADISRYVTERRPDGAETAVVTNARQHARLMRAAVKLRSAVAAMEAGIPHEMVLIDLYGALSSIGEVTGEVTNDDILDKIFSTFCIGK